uniref:Angiotensin-converting enzyme inhibitory peptide n=1 Tax=Chiropsoides quadrigatus TaxID=130731 RepID=BPP_CHIQU|nr:RecName: Full=Angiotensin-converting enzyme inhibitory peptide; Short=ACE inhibitory peptide [Chiropsoides quadrigatus]
ACPGPNPGRP